MVESLQFALRIVLALAFVGMGILHFVPEPARSMAAMIPPAMRGRRWPSPRILVVLTGLCEIAGGVGLLIPATRIAAAIALLVFLVAVFPANAYAAKHPEQFGRLAIPLWPRLMGQVVLMALIVLAVV